MPLELDSPAGRLSLVSTITVFGTPAEVALSELAIEAFYPADAATAEPLRRLAPGGSAPPSAPVHRDHRAVGRNRLEAAADRTDPADEEP